MIDPPLRTQLRTTPECHHFFFLFSKFSSSLSGEHVLASPVVYIIPHCFVTRIDECVRETTHCCYWW